MGEASFRFSDVDPPAADPPRTIYTDLPTLPDPVYLGLTMRIFNDDTVGLYMRVDGSGTGWTFTSNDLGLWATATNSYVNLDNLGYRAKPGSALTQTITIRLRAYTDAGYSSLKWTFEKEITVVFIKSDDGSWTQDFLDNFDDGTVMGWSAVNELNATGITCAAAVDYYLSANYSLKSTAYSSAAGVEMRWRINKTFATPNRNQVYLIGNVRLHSRGGGYAYIKNLKTGYDSTVLSMIGRPYDTVVAYYVPEDKWIRIVVPLPKNSSISVRFIIDNYFKFTNPAYDSRIWLDDFKIISKD